MLILNLTTCIINFTLSTVSSSATHASADEAKQRFTKAPPHTIAKIGHPQRSSSNAPVISRTKASKSSEERVNNSGTQIPSHGSLDSVSSHGYNEPPSSDNSSEAHQQKIMKEKKKKHNVVIGPSLPPYLAREKEKTETEVRVLYSACISQCSGEVIPVSIRVR